MHIQPFGQMRSDVYCMKDWCWGMKRYMFIAWRQMLGPVKLPKNLIKSIPFFTNIHSSFFKREQDYCFIELSCFVQCNIWVKNDNTNGAEVNYLDLWCNCILSARKNLSILPEQEEYCYIKTEMIMDPLCHFELPITTWKYFFVITIYDTWY